MIRSFSIAAAVVGLAVALSGCAKKIEAPYDKGVCWHAVPLKNGTVRFNKLSVNQPSLEYCAGQLEAMRLKFVGLGGSSENLMGAYQGSFIFLLPEGVFVSQTFDGPRYIALVRTGDGKLTAVGAASPTISQ